MIAHETLELPNGVRMPTVGFGTYLLDDAAAREAVAAALRIGYRHFDTAEAYQNEAGVGAAMASARSGDSVSRNDIFVTTKLWTGNEEWGMPVKTYDDTIAACVASLERLQLEWVDLYLIHTPFARERRLEQWQALVELQRTGRARAIGVSNFSEKHLEEIRAAGLPMPAANQIELHPWSQKRALVAYLREHRIQPIAYSSLAPLSTWRARAGQESAKTDEMRAQGESRDFPFKVMAQKYGVSEAQLLLRWGVQQGYGVLPKSGSPERMKQNLDLFGFEIDAADMTAIAAMDRGDGVAWSAGDPSRTL
jgi:2,5-diketo-D-gluconate reductase A